MKMRSPVELIWQAHHANQYDCGYPKPKRQCLHGQRYFVAKSWSFVNEKVVIKFLS